jgi:hypothetical protein
MEEIASSETSEYIISVRYRNPTDDHDLIKAMFKKWNFRIWTGFSWLRFRISGGLLFTR